MKQRGDHGISVPPECAPLPLDPPRFCAVHGSPAVQVSRTPACNYAPTAVASERAPRHEIAGSGTAVRRALWGLYERGMLLRPDFWALSLSAHFLSFDLEPILSSRPWRLRSAASSV